MFLAGYEGRAGMAAVVLKDGHGLDGEKLYGHLLHTLPPYAWPWFLRVQVSFSLSLFAAFFADLHCMFETFMIIIFSHQWLKQKLTCQATESSQIYL